MKKDYKDVLLLVNEDLFPSPRAIEQLLKIAGDERVSKPVIALPDIHDKDDNDYPTGIVVGAPGHIFPEIMVSGPNCGMRMINTPLEYANLKDTDIDTLYGTLVASIRTKALRAESLSRKDLLEVLKKGAAWVINRYSIAEDELQHMEMRGNCFGKREVSEEEILDSVPPIILDISRYRMGLLGSGNHFLEMQRVEEVYDQSCAGIFGLKPGRLAFLMHTGSGGLGAMVSHLYSPRSFKSREPKMHAFVYTEWLKSIFNGKRRALIKKIIKHALSKNKDLFALEAEKGEARLYTTALGCASNFAYANRTFIANQLRGVLCRQFGIKNDEVRTLYDVSHMSIRKEKEIKGQSLWVHRSGAVRAYPPDVLPPDSFFRESGQPIFMPGSMGDPTYLCVSTAKNAMTFFSMGHGAGRACKTKIGRIPENREQLRRELMERSVRLYKGLSGKIVKQAPSCFKNIGLTIDYLQKQGIIKKVAKLLPVAVLKG